MKRKYDPGSKQAVGNDCSCPIHKNNYGLGFDLNGKKCFYVEKTCVMHGWEEEVAKKDE